MTAFRLIAATGLLATGVFVTDSAEAADYYAAATGHSYWPGDSTCFGNDGYGGVTNACASAKLYSFYYPPKAVGSTSVFIVQPASNSVSCTVFEYNPVSQSIPWQTAAAGSGSLTFVAPIFGSHVTAATNLVEVRCLVNSGATLRSFLG